VVVADGIRCRLASRRPFCGWRSWWASGTGQDRDDRCASGFDVEFRKGLHVLLVRWLMWRPLPFDCDIEVTDRGPVAVVCLGCWSAAWLAHGSLGSTWLPGRLWVLPGSWTGKLSVRRVSSFEVGAIFCCARQYVV